MLANRRGFFLYQARYTIEVRGGTWAGQGRDRDGTGAGGNGLSPHALKAVTLVNPCLPSHFLLPSLPLRVNASLPPPLL